MGTTASFQHWDWATVGLVSVWAETFLYGMYATLFWASMFIMLKGIKQRTWSTKIVIWSSAMIYPVATAHISIGLYSLLQRYVRLAGTPESGTPWLTTRKWDCFAYTVLNTIVVWLFDCLLIYRCYIIWSNWYVIVAPIFLFMASVAVRVPTFIWLSFEDPMAPSPYKKLSFAAFPVEFAQNILTTGLICFRLIRQLRASRAPGAPGNNFRLSQSDIIRIITESAAIYPLLVFITTLLWSGQSDGFWVFYGMYSPVIGLLSILLTIRLHIATARPEHKPTMLTLSAWMNDSTSPSDATSHPQVVQGDNHLTTVEEKSRPVLAPET